MENNKKIVSLFRKEERPEKIIREVEKMTINRQIINKYRGTTPNFYLGAATTHEIELN